MSRRLIAISKTRVFRSVTVVLTVCSWICCLSAITKGDTGTTASATCSADSTGATDASGDIQSCLNGGGTVSLAAGGTYLIASTLTLSEDNTVFTSDGTTKATIKAASGLIGRMLIANADGFTLSKLEFVGKADPSGLNWTRDDMNPSYNDCGLYGTNVAVQDGDGFLVDDIVSRHAVCGTGFVVETGTNYTIRYSTFRDNGHPLYSTTLLSFGDGLTIGACNSCWIHHNVLHNNTDIDLVVGGGSGGVIEYNDIANSSSRHAFGGIHVGWFPSGDGDHSGITYQYNQVVSETQGMGFGIIVGYEPWWDSNFPFAFVSNAGTVINNYVSGAVVNLAIHGIGDGYIDDNTLEDPAGDWGYGCFVQDYVPTNYTAYWTGNATIQTDPTPDPIWFFHGECGEAQSAPGEANAGSLTHHRWLEGGEILSSDDNNYHLYYQLDGNLVLYNSSWQAVWSIGFTGSYGKAFMQADGNFVVYDASNNVRFSTGTYGHPGAYLCVQGDGNLVVYDIGGAVLWDRY